ncbi:MAG TPA: winged helix-turn-helix domain-containing protein [bacterium]|nr:winged helix-turn-helix domain-containing protein [bacterium]
MVNKIGDNAGKVWHYLKVNGQCSFNKLVKGAKLKDREADRAIGWLAREGKLKIVKDKNAELISISD